MNSLLPRLVPCLVPWAPAFLLAVSIGTLATVFAAQYWGGLAPCVLCWYQRAPYGLALLLAGGALVADPRWRRGLIGAIGLVFVAGAALAFFHVGVEQHWWAGTDACAGTVGQGARTLAELRAEIMAAPVARCDRVAWSLFGISMAGYNVLLSVGLAVFCFGIATREDSRGK